MRMIHNTGYWGTTESVSGPELKDFFHIQPVLYIRIRIGSGFNGVSVSGSGFTWNAGSGSTALYTTYGIRYIPDWYWWQSPRTPYTAEAPPSHLDTPHPQSRPGPGSGRAAPSGPIWGCRHGEWAPFLSSGVSGGPGTSSRGTPADNKNSVSDPDSGYRTDLIRDPDWILDPDCGSRIRIGHRRKKYGVSGFGFNWVSLDPYKGGLKMTHKKKIMKFSCFDAGLRIRIQSGQWIRPRIRIRIL